MDKKYFEEEVRMYLKDRWRMGCSSVIKGVGFEWEDGSCCINIYGNRSCVGDLFRYSGFGHAFWNDMKNVIDKYKGVSFSLAMAGIPLCRLDWLFKNYCDDNMGFEFLAGAAIGATFLVVVSVMVLSIIKFIL